jgi:hypothetical protein
LIAGVKPAASSGQFSCISTPLLSRLQFTHQTRHPGIDANQGGGSPDPQLDRQHAADGEHDRPIPEFQARYGREGLGLVVRDAATHLSSVELAAGGVFLNVLQKQMPEGSRQRESGPSDLAILKAEIDNGLYMKPNEMLVRQFR